MAAWYSSPDGLRTIRNFHDNFAREPAAMKHARKHFHKMMMDVQYYLKHKENVRMGLEYTGSAYELLKVGGKELEFDVMFVRNKKDCKFLKAEKDPNSSLYSRLKPKNKEGVEKFEEVLEGEVLSPLKVRYWFHGMLQKWLNNRVEETPGTDVEIKIKYGGPAIRATVYRNGSEWYFVDMVPAYRVRYKRKSACEIYVAKPREGDDSTWRHSFSLEEKANLIIMGKKNCLRLVIRILKVIRDRESGLENMKSFYIKCLVIQMKGRQNLDWKAKQNLSKRLLDVMLEMKDCMRTGVLMHPFNKSVNILQTLDPMVRLNIANRLERIATNELVARQVFNPASAKAIK